jgi:hypothetical protein
MKHDMNTAEQPPPGWRFRIGVSLFVSGCLSPLCIPLVTATSLSTAWKTTLSGLLMLGIPELFWLVAAAIMGKPGFNYLKAKVFGTFKRYALPERVSRTRYRIGLIMLVIPLLYGWLDPYASQLISGYEKHQVVLAIAGDVLLLASLFVLGGEFWDKLRALFIYEAQAQFAQGQER